MLLGSTCYGRFGDTNLFLRPRSWEQNVPNFNQPVRQSDCYHRTLPRRPSGRLDDGRTRRQFQYGAFLYSINFRMLQINKMASVFTSSTDFQIAQILPPTDRTVLEMWGAARMSTTGPSWKAMHRLAVHAKQNLFEFTNKYQWKMQINLRLVPFPSSFSNLLWKFLLLPFRRRKWADRRPYRISALRKLQKINFVLKEDKLFFFTVRLFLRVIDHGETCDGHVATLVSDDWKHLQIWRR